MVHAGSGEGCMAGVGRVRQGGGRSEVGQEGVRGRPGRRGCGAGEVVLWPVSVVSMFYSRCKECALDRQFI